MLRILYLLAWAYVLVLAAVLAAVLVVLCAMWFWAHRPWRGYATRA